MSTFNENPTPAQPLPVTVVDQPKTSASAPLAGQRVVGNIPRTGAVPTTATPIRPVRRK